MIQNCLFKEKKLSLEYGGSLLQGHRKGKRPVFLSKPLHLVMRSEIASFLKVFSGVIAKKILQHSKIKISKFWTERVYSRIVQWGRDYKGVINYILQNELEAKGLIAYKSRKTKRHHCLVGLPRPSASQ